MILQLPNMDTDAQRFGLTSDIILEHQLNCTAPPSLTLEQELTNWQEHQKISITRKYTYRLIAQTRAAEWTPQLPDMDTDLLNTERNSERLGISNSCRHHLRIPTELHSTVPPSLTSEQELTTWKEHQKNSTTTNHTYHPNCTDTSCRNEFPNSTTWTQVC